MPTDGSRGTAALDAKPTTPWSAFAIEARPIAALTTFNASNAAALTREMLIVQAIVTSTVGSPAPTARADRGGR
jgi:hypothetical protein